MKKYRSEINPRFVEYFQETFFTDRPEEFERFLDSLTKPLPKTIRVNTNRISVDDFKARAQRNGWILTPTDNPTVFRIDRTDTAMPLGHTLEHLLGYFYIQELSASMSVQYLSTSPLTPLLLEEREAKIPQTSSHHSPHPLAPSPFGGEGERVSRSEAVSP